MKKLSFVSIFTLLFICITSMAVAEWEFTQLTSNSYHDQYPQINASGHIVWEISGGASGYEIMYYDGSTFTQLTDDSYSEFKPLINASGHVVWYGLVGGYFEIFYYDGSTVTQLTNNAYSDLYPQINDSGQVVWEADVGDENTEIFYYDGNTTTQLTNHPYPDGQPQINASGHVVWDGYDNDDDWKEIFYYDGNTTTQLTNYSYGAFQPQINASGHVVWSGYNGDDEDNIFYEIFYYDGSTTTQLTNNAYDDYDPQINASGHVVWRGYVSKDNFEIFYYDGSTITRLTNNSYRDKEPKINASGHAVWEGGESTNHEIFYYDGSTITPLTNSVYDNRNPQINASGHVVWQVYDSDGEDWEIFLARNLDVDTDYDSISDGEDNCPDDFNSEQLDADSDGIGDLCDDTPGCGGCGNPACEKSLTAKVEELLTHYYWNILGRAPDSGGLNYWTGEIMSLVSSGGDIKEGFISFAQSFFNSQEYLDRNRIDVEYVTDLYNTFFDRPPDSGGLNYWTDQLSQGMTRNEVLDYFVHSPEFNDFMDELFFGTS